MGENNHSDGAFVISRSLFESDIWFKPPEYLKVFLYLIGKAAHKNRKYKGYTLERGQYFCNYSELLEQIDYKVGFRKNKAHESYMKNLMKYLRSTLMITTMKKPRGIIITICNYDSYQDLKLYEKTNEKTNEKTSSKPALNQTSRSINKNYKNGKNSRIQESFSVPEKNKASADVIECEVVQNEGEPEKKKPKHPNMQFIDMYISHFQNQFGQLPLINYGKDCTLAKKLLNTYTLSELDNLLGLFFESDDDFINKTGFTIGVFCSTAQKLSLSTKIQKKTTGSRITDQNIKNASEWLKMRRERNKA